MKKSITKPVVAEKVTNPLATFKTASEIKAEKEKATADKKAVAEAIKNQKGLVKDLAKKVGVANTALVKLNKEPKVARTKEQTKDHKLVVAQAKADIKTAVTNLKVAEKALKVMLAPKKVTKKA